MCNAQNQHMRAGEGHKEAKDYFLAGSLYDIDFVKEEDGWKMCKWALSIIYTQGTMAVITPS